MSHRENDFVIDIYNGSAKMSTYLLAFIVCDFEQKETTTQNGVKVVILIFLIYLIYYLIWFV